MSSFAVALERNLDAKIGLVEAALQDLTRACLNFPGNGLYAVNKGRRDDDYTEFTITIAKRFGATMAPTIRTSA